MSASSELVRRSGDLKGELVDFAQGSRFARSFRQALEERFAAAAAVDEEQFINFLDWFVLQHRLPDGRTVAERFVAARPDLSGVFSRMPRRSFLVARLVPIGDEWLLSGATSVLPAASSAEARGAAAEIAVRHPALAFRDPERLALGWALQRQDRRCFVEFFGSDLVVCAGSELAGRMRAYGGVPDA